ncbi:3-oxoacyl-[acyl-carrier protein] reductase [Pseudomonas citronellolis]|uniref:3-oxoacyl-[acyl-carrier protein] reductase n=1 Tax=Pseudomonas citronellolis TaxID=53408 RepID=A0AAQ1KK07_9PSED|nr:SDR family oxidoreductase [Pseudomonas citronellolis]TGC21551.1 oxidoreductase [Pseudomonas citronellolis]SFD60131.1 3-oxoacyl-[acyl-carrier protein] reductase [Pseudomonas citronellolis]
MKRDEAGNDKVAIVFGGSRGIGAAAARQLAADGFSVALTYVSRPASAKALTDEIEAGGGRALAIQADSKDAAAIRNAVAAAVERFGAIDVAVVNAGVLRLARIDALGVEDLDLMLDVNIRGVILSIQAAVASMRDGGRVITIGSNSASGRTSVEGAVYAMTKAAVARLVQGLALDLAARRITVNNIQPGPTATDMTQSHLDALAELVPLGRVAQPMEIAGLVAYLASPAAAHMTGASLTLDGGYAL